MRLNPKSDIFAILYGLAVSILALYIAYQVKPQIRVPIFFLFYITGYAFASYMGWIELDPKKSDIPSKPADVMTKDADFTNKEGTE